MKNTDPKLPTTANGQGDPFGMDAVPVNIERAPEPVTDDGTYRCGVCDRTTTEEALASFCGGASGVDTDREWQSTTLCSPCAVAIDTPILRPLGKEA